MAKKDKIITFQEQNHKEFVKDVFNMIFVVGCFICVTKALFSAPIDWIFDNLPQNTLTISLKIIASAVYWGVGLFTPFIIYRIIKYGNVTEIFSKSKIKSNPIYFIFGILSVSGLGVSLIYYSSFIVEALRSNGYIIHEHLPETGDNYITYGVFILSSAFIVPLFQELTFRGIVISDLRKNTPVFAVIISAMLCGLSRVSFQFMPYLVVTGLVLGWLYIKTNSVVLTFAANGIMNASAAILWIYRQNNAEGYNSFMAITAPIFLSLGIISLFVLATFTKLKQTSEKGFLTKKECLKGFFGSFAMWIFIFITVFEVFFLYIDKPRKKEEGEEEAPIQKNNNNEILKYANSHSETAFYFSEQPLEGYHLR